MLELAPLFWERARARLDPVELAHDLGQITVPPFGPSGLRRAITDFADEAL